MSIKQEIEAVLTRNFAPKLLEVVNESHKHAGHAGHDGSGESHFRVVISGNEIKGNSRLAKHREIIAALGPIMGRIHALQIDLK